MTEATFQTIPLDQIKADPKFNSREALGDISELRDSIAANGVTTPVEVVEIKGKGGKVHYALNAGFRRFAAASELGLEGIPAQVLPGSMTLVQRFTRNMIENIQRRALNPIEEAMGFARLLNAGMSADEVCLSLGVTKTLLTQRAKLLEYHPKIQAAVRTNDISVTQAGLLSQVPEEKLEDFIQLASTIGVTKLEDAIEKLLAPPAEPKEDEGDGDGEGDDGDAGDEPVDKGATVAALVNACNSILIVAYGETPEFSDNMSRIRQVDFSVLGESDLRRLEAVFTDVADTLNRLQAAHE